MTEVSLETFIRPYCVSQYRGSSGLPWVVIVFRERRILNPREMKT